ncbi:histidine--tRNA ligase [Clostridium estertheticum]|uniref:Histidine--tRNA ligase n=1 Tax=Clostridium estertheticum TaxID=238834 RepID=A0AA47EME4_9CLOT|nr:histidine--tRNA ligase [Clostridium estertheticum]MBU3154720.1 histidine--tRNA ligase [Clostridium estertheticum]MBU3198864.1 histidine--tRNA ligase [Clostridium estertheticum]WAG61701.1 histidine--tRNA ligase [Clostridium estertheticum]WAG64176.1 histidine--tRNA ligase [Clostridium estertheticum]
MKNEIVKPSILPGFMELLPADQIEFNKLADTIRKTYESFGFMPIDTPVIEKSEILLAKGGGETEKQIYRFSKGSNDLSLRFDLTVPLARYVAQNSNSLTFPFRRYQIGKVYRGERNQKGRFREFYQCDIDIVGSNNLSILNDAEIPSIIYSIFNNLGFEDFTIKVNNRKILNGFFESLGIEDKSDVLRTIDKIDKIGVVIATQELLTSGLSKGVIDKILEFINARGSNEDILLFLKNLDISNSTFKDGVSELSTVSKYVKLFGVPDNNFKIDLKISRGLDYYTGTVYETFLNEYPSIGSVCSGGRYDNLAEYYTKQKLPGVGISIGLTRLFYQLNEVGFFKNDTNSCITKVLVIPLDNNVIDYAISFAKSLRDKGIVTEIYLEDTKIVKKLGYANKLGIPYTILIGDEEIQNKTVTVKNMVTGLQKTTSLDEAYKMVNI